MKGRRKTVRISESEWSIMKAMWDGCAQYGRGMTLGEISQSLSSTMEWSSTTIRTLVIRLADKGMVEIDKTTGVYKYLPTLDKTECMRAEVESFVTRVFDRSAYDLVALIIRSGGLSEKEKAELVKLLHEA